MQIVKKAGCIIATILFMIGYSRAQTASINKLKQDLAQTKESDTVYLNILSSISDKSESIDIDSMLSYAKRAYFYASKHQKELSENTKINTLIRLGNAFWQSGNYPDAKETYFKALKRAEPLDDSLQKAVIYNGIAIVSRNEGEYRQAINYFSKAEALTASRPYSDEYWSSVTDKGKAYEQLNILDSALLYVKQSERIQEYRIAHKQGASGGVYAAIGIVYSKLGNEAKAIEYFDKAIAYAREGSPRLLARAYVEYAEHFDRTDRPRDAVSYATAGLLIDQQYGFLVQLMDASKLLAKIYAAHNYIDSAFKYQTIMINTKEKLFSREKINRLQNIEFQEEERQQEMKAEAIKAKEDRSKNIEYILIALGLVVFTMLFLLLSRSMITNTNVIRFVGVLGLLIVFEFFNLLLHPILEKVTHHSPFLMLLALVCLSALLIPAHHKIEKWAIAKLVEKNKKIRLANAKKTIEELDKG